MTSIPFGSTGTLTVTDNYGGISYVGGTPPGVWSTDDADTSYMLWTTPNQVGTPSGWVSRLDWTPPPTSISSLALRMVVKHPSSASGTAPALDAEIWKSDLSTLVVLPIPNLAASTAWQTLAGTAVTDPTALSWLAAGTAFLRITLAAFSGAVGLSVGDTMLYTEIVVDTIPAGLPPLRQYPRDDYLGGAPRQGHANGSTSRQASTRQGWINTYR